MRILTELDLIRDIASKARIFDKKVIKGIGDDAAAIDRGRFFELISTDTLVCGDHFCLDWSTPSQIGKKAVEVNVSDIAAMAGTPKYILVSLVLPKDVPQTFVSGFYDGFLARCKKYGISLVGGNITHGKEISVTITIIGEVLRKNLRLRSGACEGDLFCVTGLLGVSKAGLEALRTFQTLDACKRAQIPNYVLKKHLEPRCRSDISSFIGKYATSMIDISDGLASEVRHICEESGVGAKIFVDKIPLHPLTLMAARRLQKSACDFALSGGEDFELLFTVSLENFKKISQRVDIFCVGDVMPRKEGIFLQDGTLKRELPCGYDHFDSEV